MIIKFDLFCPNVRRKVRIQVSIPKNFKKEDIVYDSLYMLDGQNIFKDSEASFGRSLRFGKYLGIMSNKLNKRICGIAISNANSDLGRLNEYAPFMVVRKSSKEWDKQDISINRAFTKDLIEVIIPYIENHFPVKKEKESRFIFGSSLGAWYASYLANNTNMFGVAGLFSNCPFLNEEAFYENLNSHLDTTVRYFNYVGFNEFSDNDFDQTLYYNSSVKLHNFYKEHGIQSKLLVDINGSHNEACWEKHVLEFLTYIYFDDISYSY